MTLEESWGTTLAMLRQIAALGYAVSVFRFPSSLLGTRLGAVEMYVLDISTDPPAKQVERIDEGEPGDLNYRCACFLAEMVGIDLNSHPGRKCSRNFWPCSCNQSLVCLLE